MEIEQERGISITSTVLAFPYRTTTSTCRHARSPIFRRTPIAPDRGRQRRDGARRRRTEPQTLKLFEVTRRRRTPIFTFVNKLDRPAQHLELLEEIENTLAQTTRSTG